MLKKIIVVDDSRAIRYLVKIALRQGDFLVVEAQDGEDGLVKLDEHRDAALMLCDVNMPRMNGLDMVEAARADPARPRVPVVMLTADGRGDLMARAQQAGVEAWLVKPFQPEQLLALVNRLTG